MHKKNEKIDLVYLWCDGREPAFQERKAQYLAEDAQPKTVNIAGDVRFFDNEELRYSLRSLEMYAPWINHVYIITDRQVPYWLNTDCPKVTVVDHSEIMPQELIPCFNSTVIEHFLPNVPHLENKFIFGNDDTFFAAPVRPQDFFQGEKPIVRVREMTRFTKVKQALFKLTGYYEKIEYKEYLSILSSLDLLEATYGEKGCYYTHHNFDGFTRANYLRTLQKFAKEFEHSKRFRFRNKSCLQRIIFGLDAVYSGHAVLDIVQPVKNDQQKVFSFFGKEYKLEQAQHILEHNQPKLFCLNACNKTDPSIKQHSKEFLERLFPEPSQFEKQFLSQRKEDF